MLEGVWRYFDGTSCSGGIVMAETQEEAHEKAVAYIKARFKRYGWEDDNREHDIQVWPCVSDDDFDENFPDVLVVYY